MRDTDVSDMSLLENVKEKCLNVVLVCSCVSHLGKISEIIVVFFSFSTGTQLGQ